MVSTVPPTLLLIIYIYYIPLSLNYADHNCHKRLQISFLPSSIMIIQRADNLRVKAIRFLAGDRIKFKEIRINPCRVLARVKKCPNIPCASCVA
jgi:hypothetical protein